MREPLRNILIRTAPKSDIEKGEKPISNRTERTIAQLYHKILMENPYVFTYPEFLKVVHEKHRKKEDLKLDTYRIHRAEVCKLWGWGIHVDKNEKLALVGCETDKYRELSENPTVKKKEALNPPRKRVLARDKLLGQIS